MNLYKIFLCFTKHLESRLLKSLCTENFQFLISGRPSVFDSPSKFRYGTVPVFSVEMQVKFYFFKFAVIIEAVVVVIVTFKLLKCTFKNFILPDKYFISA